MKPCTCGHEPITQMRRLATGREVRVSCGCGETTGWHPRDDIAKAHAEWDASVKSLPKRGKSA